MFGRCKQDVGCKFAKSASMEKKGKRGWGEREIKENQKTFFYKRISSLPSKGCMNTPRLCFKDLCLETAEYFSMLNHTKEKILLTRNKGKWKRK